MDVTLNPAGIATQALTRGLAHEEFDDLVREHQQRIFRVVMALVRDSELASNLAQDCFVRAYESRATFRGDSSVSTWLIRIAMNLVRDHARNRRQAFWKRLFQRPADEPDVESAAESVKDARSGPDRQLLAKEELSVPAEAVAATPAEYVDPLAALVPAAPEGAAPPAAAAPAGEQAASGNH